MYQKALAKFAEQAENFSNMVYEQSDSLQPVVKAFGVTAQTSQWMSREEATKFFKSDKLVSSIFSTEVLKDKRNTEAIEAAPNTLVSARVLEYKPAAARNFAEIAPVLKDYLKAEQAAAMAKEKGAKDLAELRQGKEVEGLNWIPPVVITRNNAQGLNDDVMKQVFKIDTSTLPAYAGVDNKNIGYTLIRVSRIDITIPEDEAEKKLTQAEVQEALATEYVSAYLGSLKSKTDITVNKQLLNAGSQQ
jgi:peptidyl-prolyl cis-trans isomerase D